MISVRKLKEVEVVVKFYEYYCLCSQDISYRIEYRDISIVSCRIVIAIILHRTKRYSAPL